MHHKKREKIYKKIKGVFRDHYPCAFRNDIGSLDSLDCLTYMAEDIIKIFEEEYEKNKPCKWTTTISSPLD